MAPAGCGDGRRSGERRQDGSGHLGLTGGRDDLDAGVRRRGSDGFLAGAAVKAVATVGTVTEVHDYLRLLYARAGTPHCPNCGRAVERQSPAQIADVVLTWPDGTRIEVLAPLVRVSIDDALRVQRYILRSISRTMPGCNSPAENELVGRARALIARYDDMAEMIRLGAVPIRLESLAA